MMHGFFRITDVRDAKLAVNSSVWFEVCIAKNYIGLTKMSNC